MPKIDGQYCPFYDWDANICNPIRTEENQTNNVGSSYRPFCQGESNWKMCDIYRRARQVEENVNKLLGCDLLGSHYDKDVKEFYALERESSSISVTSTDFTRIADKYASLAQSFRSIYRRDYRAESADAKNYMMKCKEREKMYRNKYDEKIKEKENEQIRQIGQVYEQALNDFSVVDGKSASTATDFKLMADKYASLAVSFRSLTCYRADEKNYVLKCVKSSWTGHFFVRQLWQAEVEACALKYKLNQLTIRTKFKLWQAEVEACALKCAEREKVYRYKYSEKVNEEKYEHTVKDFHAVEGEVGGSSSNFKAIADKYASLIAPFRSLINYTDGAEKYALKCEEGQKIYRCKHDEKVKEEMYNCALNDFSVVDGKSASTATDFKLMADKYASLAQVFDDISNYKESKEYAIECTEKKKAYRTKYDDKVKEDAYERVVSDFFVLDGKERYSSSTDFKVIADKYALLAKSFKSMSNYKESKEYAIECTEREKICRTKHDEKIKEEAANLWAAQNLCRYCGGQFGGLFTKKCKSCGKPK